MFNQSKLGRNVSFGNSQPFFRRDRIGHTPRNFSPPVTKSAMLGQPDYSIVQESTHQNSLFEMKNFPNHGSNLENHDVFDLSINHSGDLPYGGQHDYALNNQVVGFLAPEKIAMCSIQFYWPHWNQNMSAMATEEEKMRAMKFSLTSFSNREHNPALMKTKICDHWRRSGSCTYGDACWYAHGEDDLRKVNISRNHRLSEERAIGEPERNTQYIYRGLDMAKEDVVNVVKPADELKAPAPKRSSTNVKGLTVNIPSNIAFKEPANDSMPLSPAQERWISMSVGSNLGPQLSTVDKENEPGVISSSSTVTGKNGMDIDQEKKLFMENIFERRHQSGKFLRDDDIDDMGFLSPNPFTYPQAPSYSNRCAQNTTMNAHPRPFSRGPHQMNFSTQQFGGMSSQHSTLSSSQEHARPSRSGKNNCNYFDRQLPAQKSASNIRSTRENLQIPTGHSAPPPIQQAIWNVAGEICQRQKDIETCGLRGSADQHSMQFADPEVGRLIAKLKKNDLSCLRFMLESGMINERDIPRETWNDLINSGNLLSQPPPSLSNQFYSNNNGLSNIENNGSDCSCKNNRSKIPHNFSPFSPHFTQHHQQSQHSNFSQQQQHYYSHAHQQQQILRQQGNNPFGGPTTMLSELSAPPKIFESLLPSDENFSIWLNPKPKKDSGRFMYSHGIDQSNSDASLLTKMEVLRLEKVPITEEEMQESSGIGKDDKRSISESSSPPVLTLMELLSNENILDESNGNSKTTMFDFDTLKIAETLRTSQQFSAQSSQTSSSKSPRFFYLDEKTPSLDDYFPKPSPNVFTPLTGQTPSFMEQCDFFAAGGSCPFGDGCQLSHETPKEQLKAL